MKLVKAVNSEKHVEDFGLSDQGAVYFYDYRMECEYEGVEYHPVSNRKMDVSPVVRINACWMDRPVKVRCHIADTQEKRIKGLQGFGDLPENEGMFFPYKPYAQVRMHQASVPYPLDIIFLCDDAVCQIERNTKVGSTDIWTCPKCTGVIEVNGGFCATNNIEVGDCLALFAVSEFDIKATAKERERDSLQVKEAKTETYNDSQLYDSVFVHLMSSVADNL